LLACCCVSTDNFEMSARDNPQPRTKNAKIEKDSSLGKRKSLFQPPQVHLYPPDPEKALGKRKLELPIQADVKGIKCADPCAPNFQCSSKHMLAQTSDSEQKQSAQAEIDFAKDVLAYTDELLETLETLDKEIVAEGLRSAVTSFLKRVWQESEHSQKYYELRKKLQSCKRSPGFSRAGALDVEWEAFLQNGGNYGNKSKLEAATLKCFREVARWHSVTSASATFSQNFQRPPAKKRKIFEEYENFVMSSEDGKMFDLWVLFATAPSDQELFKKEFVSLYQVKEGLFTDVQEARKWVAQQYVVMSEVKELEKQMNSTVAEFLSKK